MKKIVIAFLALCLFCGCKKENETTNAVVGKWAWFKSSAWTTATPQSTGQTWELIFNRNMTCSQTGTHLPPKNGTYTVTSDSLKITFTGDSYVTRFAILPSHADTLILDAGSFVDGPVHSFVRIN
ncbi:MAG TPA: hypothetical protein VF476_01895 [Chitinophagaceae bacterium]